jgi:hypothetical protein
LTTHNISNTKTLPSSINKVKENNLLSTYIEKNSLFDNKKRHREDDNINDKEKDFNNSSSSSSYDNFLTIKVFGIKYYSDLVVPKDSILYSLIMLCEDGKNNKANRCLYNKDYYPIAEFNNYSDIGLQVFLPFQNKIVINERIQKNLYNNISNKRMIYD